MPFSSLVALVHVAVTKKVFVSKTRIVNLAVGCVKLILFAVRVKTAAFPVRLAVSCFLQDWSVGV